MRDPIMQAYAMETFGELNDNDDVYNMDDEARLSIEGYSGAHADTGHDWEAVGYAQNTPVDRAIAANGRSVFVTEA